MSLWRGSFCGRQLPASLLHGAMGSVVLAAAPVAQILTGDWRHRREIGEHALMPMAWDGGRARLVLFGGVGLAFSRETWEFVDLTWTKRTPATVPPARYSHATTFDPVRRRVLLFGGLSTVPFAPAPLADTWA